MAPVMISPPERGLNWPKTVLSYGSRSGLGGSFAFEENSLLMTRRSSPKWKDQTKSRGLKKQTEICQVILDNVHNHNIQIKRYIYPEQ